MWGFFISLLEGCVQRSRKLIKFFLH
jgi:hypothetical protein